MVLNDTQRSAVEAFFVSCVRDAILDDLKPLSIATPVTILQRALLHSAPWPGFSLPRIDLPYIPFLTGSGPC